MKLEIIIGGKTLDITNDSNFYQTIDFNNIYDNQAMKISYSDKFDIPLTKNNSEILGVNLLTNGDYTSPFKLLSCEVKQDGVTTMEDALLRIESIDYTENLARCYIKSGDVDFGQRISGLNLGVVDNIGKTGGGLGVLLTDLSQSNWITGMLKPYCPVDVIMYNSKDSTDYELVSINSRTGSTESLVSISKGSAVYLIQDFLNELFPSFGVTLNMTDEAIARLEDVCIVSSELKRSIGLGRYSSSESVTALIYADGTVRNESGGQEIEPIIEGSSLISYDVTEIYDQSARFNLICNGDVKRVFALNNDVNGKMVDYLADDETEIDVVSSSFDDNEVICKMVISTVESEDNNVLINLENSFDDIKIEDFLESLQLLYGLKIEYVGQTANIKVAEDIEDIVFNDLSEKLNQVQKREFEPSEYGKSFTYTLDYPDWADKVGDGGIKRNSRLSEGTEKDIEVAPFYNPTDGNTGIYNETDIAIGSIIFPPATSTPRDFIYKDLDGTVSQRLNVPFVRYPNMLLNGTITINNIINTYYSSRLSTLKKEIQLTVEMILTPFDIVSLKENNFIYLKQTSRRYQVVNIDKYNPEQLTTVTLLEIQE